MNRLVLAVLVGLIVGFGALGARSGSRAQSIAATPSAAVVQLQATAEALNVPVACVIEAFGNPEARSDSTPAAATPVSVLTRVTIELYDLGYNPCAITIPADTRVAIELVNTGSAVGNFVIDELGVQSDLVSAGETKELSVDLSPGVYTFYSDVPGQIEAGRSGVLIARGVGTTTEGTPILATPAP